MSAKPVTILGGVVGSHAYGLAREESDVDFLGAFVSPTEDLLRINPQFQPTVSTTKPDATFHEIGKYLKLALNGNPTILELLWLDRYEAMTETGDDLVDIRDALVCTKRVRGAYGGYARDQLKKLITRQSAGKRGFSPDTANRTAKHARHCFRLIEQGQHLLETGEIELKVSDPTKFFQFDDMPVDRMVSLFNDADREFMAAKSVLPEFPDTPRVEAFLAKVRRDYYQEGSASYDVPRSD